MNNYEALYNKAMAHVAMLKETLVELHKSLDFCDIQIEWKIAKAIDSTSADAETWLNNYVYNLFKQQIEEQVDNGVTGGVLLKLEALEKELAESKKLENKTMAHNAMLREALGKYEEVYPYVCDLKDNAPTREHHEGLTQIINLWLRYGRVALNATDADAERWEKKRREQVMLAVHPLQPEYEKLKKQLETIKTELETFKNDINNLLNGLL